MKNIRPLFAATMMAATAAQAQTVASPRPPLDIPSGAIISTPLAPPGVAAPADVPYTVIRPAPVLKNTPKAAMAKAAACDNIDGRFCVPRPEEISYPTVAPIGSIVVNTIERRLYLVTGQNLARRYVIAVGKESANHMLAGEYMIYRKAEWPDWYPLRKAQIAEGLPQKVPGGPGNPLGARALYLATLQGKDDYYRIHGNNNPSSIGKAVSHGCFRLHNEDVEDLYGRVPEKTRVFIIAPPPRPRAAPAIVNYDQRRPYPPANMDLGRFISGMFR